MHINFTLRNTFNAEFDFYIIVKLRFKDVKESPKLVNFPLKFRVWKHKASFKLC